MDFSVFTPHNSYCNDNRQIVGYHCEPGKWLSSLFKFLFYSYFQSHFMQKNWWLLPSILKLTAFLLDILNCKIFGNAEQHPISVPKTNLAELKERDPLWNMRLSVGIEIWARTHYSFNAQLLNLWLSFESLPTRTLNS